MGSSHFITNLEGEIAEHIEYVPFGEVFIEERNGSFSTPYLYNGKELDSETGYYYYGARYYNPRVSLWLSVDPLAVYNPVMESEFYGDGQHNGGVYNSGNLNPYIYTYNNPVVYVDPNGKQNKVTDMIMGFFIPPSNSGNSPLRQMQQGLMFQKAFTISGGATIAGIADYYSGGTLTKLFLLYELGNAYHSAEMQSYWRDRGNEAAARAYEQEGADASKSIVMYAAFNGVARFYGILRTFNPNSIRFSQSSVSGADDIINSMNKNGWKGNPIDIVKMEDGIYTTVDNTRVYAAQVTGTRVQAITHKASDEIPFLQATRFKNGKTKSIPKTWREAVQNRIQNQNSTFRSTYPIGSFVKPISK